jgi:CelD/BcsL family acetyltransferase involved in cellulose biosynthesis
MNMMARMDDLSAPAVTSALARIVVHHDLESAEAVWRSLECPSQFSTPYQRFDFLAAWQSHIGRLDGAAPFIVVGYDQADEAAFVIPLARTRKWGASIASFMGGKHSAFNMPLWRRSFAESAGEREIVALLRMLAVTDLRPDVLAFGQQPEQWQGMRNPFAMLARQPSPNGCPRLAIVPGSQPNERISRTMRHRLRNKERKLQSLAGYRYYVAATEADVKRLLDAFFDMKRQRMALQGLPDVFSEPGVEVFVRAICSHGLDRSEPLVRLHALECDAEVIAVFSGMADAERFSMMFNTYTLSDSARSSPGLILIRHIIDDYAAAGHRMFDLGVGAADYKSLFCKDNEPLYDSFIPLTARGKAAAAALAWRGRAVGWIKKNPRLFDAAKRVRRAAE